MKPDMFDSAACGRSDQVKLVLRGSLRYTPYSKLAAVDFPTVVISFFSNDRHDLFDRVDNTHVRLNVSAIVCLFG